MSDVGIWVNTQFEQLAQWEYSFAFGMLHSFVTSFLNDQRSRDELTAVVAIIEMHRDRWLRSLAAPVRGEIDLDLAASQQVERTAPGVERT